MRTANAIDGSTAVVTGATSGIGRATALALAARGADLVLVARDAAALAEVAAACRDHGGAVVVEPVDVSDTDAVDAVAARTVARFGRIDAWVNAASVMMFGAVLDCPPDDVRRVLDVNIMGTVNGCRAALPHMRAQHSGVLVNVSSILGIVALPLGSAYTMSKFAIRGLSAGLRQELRMAGARGVHVCAVLPAAIDTPIFGAAANHSGRRPRAVPPVYTPERVARTIVARIRHPRRETVAGGLLGRAFVLQHKIAPALAERLMAEDVDHFGLSRITPAPYSSGNLYRPAPGPAQVHGGWDGRRRERRRAAAGIVAIGTVAAAAAARWAIRR